jgi:type I restriction enzyme S subunit
MGQSPPSITYNIERDGIPFFQGKGDFGEIYPTARVWCKCPLKIARPGDVLISVRAPVGSVNIANDMSCIGRGLAALRPNNSLDVLWLFYYLRLHEDQISALGKGSTFSAITKTDLDSIFIPLPSLSEQKRILARINDLFSRIREAKRLRQEAQQEAERLWQSVLADTFPKPGTKLPEGWQWLRLDECITTIESGKRPKGGVRKLKIEKGIFSIGGEHLTWDGGFDFSRPRLIPEEYYYSIKKGKIKPHDILIVKDGATTGKTAYVSENFPFQDACVNEHVFIIRAKKDLILPKYLFLFLLSSFGKKQILSTFHGAAQGGINSQFVKRVFIPVTSLANQKNIVSYLESTKEKIIALKNSQEEVDFEINMLEKIILEKAFRGEL